MDKIKIKTIYGISKNERRFYFSDKKEWEENKCCSDRLDNDVYNTIYDIGLIEEMEGIWSKQDKKTTKQEIENKLIELGFEYNEEFEKFMR